VASRIAHQSTVKRLESAKSYFETLDELMLHFRFTVSKGTLSRVLRGCSVSEYAENDIRAKLGLEPIQTYVVEACPDCGAAHTGRCHGKPVASVEVLSDGDTIIRKRPAQTRTRKRYHRPCMDDAEYAEYLAWRAERRSA
jgi:predicted RNA-binding Zn-ribbon protein involved in translation (DUF1610 family)